MRRWRARLAEPTRGPANTGDEAVFAILRGDFTTAVQRLRSLADLEKTARDDATHAGIAVDLAGVLEEAGQAQEAIEVARAFLARRAAYQPHPGRTEEATLEDPTGRLLAIERRAGGLTVQQYRAALRARLDWWERRLGKSWLNYFVWRMQYAAAVQTAAEAREALQARARFGRAYEYTAVPYDDAALARTDLLAGRIDEALPELERAARDCSYTFGYTLEHVRTWYFLGEARAAKGDRAGACAAYGKLLGHWGDARPRSVTAQKARRRWRELGCS
jgi:predicted Zn-dependent protease